MNKCPECGSMEIEQFKEKHCKNCGLVIDDSPAEVGQYGTITTRAETQFVNGKYVKAAWMLTAKQKNLAKAKKKLSSLASRLSLPKYIENDAYSFYKEAVHKDLCVGRDNNSILLGCVYASCNIHGIPKTVVELSEYSRVDKKHILRAYLLIQKELKLQIQPCDPIDLLPRYTTNLGLSPKCLGKAVEIMNRIKGTAAYSGKNPKSIVAAVLYLSARMCKEKLSQRDLANHIGLMEVTIRRRYKEIERVIDNFRIQRQ